jgi:site-specific recombinase XerD
MNKAISFLSVLSEQMQQFVAFKRMQGYDYTDQARTLSYFDRFFLEECGGVQDPCLSLDALQDYVATTVHLAGFSRRQRLSSLREFSRYLHARNPNSALLPREIVPLRKSTVRFYRLEPEQVADLMTAAMTVLPSANIQTHAIAFLIGLLYCTGLRISEALNLTLGNIDMQRSMLHVAKGKFGKQRLVPMSPSTLAALSCYLAVRSPHAGTGCCSALFVGAYDKALSYQQAYRGFHRLCRHCGLGGKPLPRLHDLRHNYACRRLALWREEGRDVNAMLPILATAMGHVDIRHTQIYLHVELGDLRHAASLLNTRLNTHSENK